MIGSREFPRLTATNHRVTSAATPEYNCVAWAAGEPADRFAALATEGVKLRDGNSAKE